MNLANNLEQSAFYFPDRPALSEGATEISYAQLDHRASQIATGLLSMGVNPGDFVGIFAGSTIRCIMGTIKSFEEFEVWKTAREIARQVYILTKRKKQIEPQGSSRSTRVQIPRFLRIL